MKTLLVSLTLLMPLPLAATNYTVKAGGGGSFTTMAACASQMSTNGTGVSDTCMVFAGTYAEDVTIPAGSSGNYKIFTVNGSDTVIVHSFTMNSHDKIVGNCAAPSTQGTCGFSIQNPSSPTNAPCISTVASVTDAFVTGNNLYACGVYMVKMASTGSASNFFVQNNTMSYSCSTVASPNVCTAASINASNVVWSGNYVSHVADGPYLTGSYIYLINNHFGPTIDTDCGSSSSNCHIDFMQADSGSLAKYIVIEGNKINSMTTTGIGDAHGIGLFQAEACGGNCSNAIVRFNVVSNVNGGGIIDDNSGASIPPAAWEYVKDYNNSWIYDGLPAVGNGITGFSHGSFGGSNINDIFVLNFTTSNWNPYSCGAGDTCPPATPLFTYGNNLVWCTLDGVTSATPCAPFGHQYGSGAWTSDPGNIVANPTLNNLAGGDYSLKSGSPALNAGTYLTTVAAGDSGSGTSLVVTDAGFFQDGGGTTGVAADCISVTTVGNHVCATAVNYSTNTITLAGSISRSVGDHIWLYSDASGSVVLSGSAPNMGSQFQAPASTGGSQFNGALSGFLGEL